MLHPDLAELIFSFAVPSSTEEAVLGGVENQLPVPCAEQSLLDAVVLRTSSTGHYGHRLTTFKECETAHLSNLQRNDSPHVASLDFIPIPSLVLAKPVSLSLRVSAIQTEELSLQVPLGKLEGLEEPFAAAVDLVVDLDGMAPREGGELKVRLVAIVEADGFFFVFCWARRRRRLRPGWRMASWLSHVFRAL